MTRLYSSKTLEGIVAVDEKIFAGKPQQGFLKTTWLNALKGKTPVIAVNCQNMLSLRPSSYSNAEDGDLVQRSGRDGEYVYIPLSDWNKTFGPVVQKISQALEKKPVLNLVKHDESSIFRDTLESICEQSLSFGTVNSYNSAAKGIYLSVLGRVCQQQSYAPIVIDQKPYTHVSESSIHILLDYIQELKRRFSEGQGTDVERKEFEPILSQFHTGVFPPVVKKEMTGSFSTALREPSLRGYI